MSPHSRRIFELEVNIEPVPVFPNRKVPSDSVSPYPTGDGPAIAREQADHLETASYGNSLEAQEYRAAQAELIEKGDYAGAQQMDIDDIQSKFGSKYDTAIQDMLKYSIITILCCPTNERMFHESKHYSQRRGGSD